MTTQISIPAKYPKWMPPLNEFLNQGKHSLTFLAIETAWPNFVAQCGKPKIVKSKEEKEAAQANRLDKQIKNKKLWDAIAQSGNADTNLRRFAMSYKDRLAAEQGESTKRRRVEPDIEQDLDEQQEEEEEEEEEQEEQGEEREEEEEEEEEEKEEEEEGQEEEKKDNEAIRSSIEKQFENKVSIKELEKDKREFFSIIAEYGIGVDEKVAQLFNQMFERALSQTKALDTVENLIHTVLE